MTARGNTKEFIIGLCRQYDSETDLLKRHHLGIEIDDAASTLSDKEVKRIIRVLKGVESID